MWWKSFLNDLTNEGYKFHFSKDDTLESTIRLDYRFPNISNVNDFKKQVKKNLNQIIKEHKIQIVFPVANMGESIYLSLVGFFPMNNINKIETCNIDEETITNKNILIFDDSIKTGDTIKNQLEEILLLKPNKIIVFSLVTRSDTYFRLSKEYSNNENIEFFNVVTIPKEAFTDVWRVLIWPFIEYHGLPLLETPYVAGEVGNIDNLKDLYRKLVIDKKKAASIINPAVVEQSLVVKGSINYTNFIKSNHRNINIYNSKLFLRFFFLRLTASRIIFVIYPELRFSDLKIDENICLKKPAFSFCFKEKYDAANVCPDCVLFNLCKDINEHIYDICKDLFGKSKLIKENKEFLDRYYPDLSKIIK
jgi:hypothetical protein